MHILYIGSAQGTSLHRAEALRRLGHAVSIIDPWELIAKASLRKRMIGKFIYEVGASWLEHFVRRRLGRLLKNQKFDVIWSDQCELIGAHTAAILKEQAEHLITYIIDDPFGGRDKKRFSLFRESLSQYDLVVVVREPNVSEAYINGAKSVLQVQRSADEIAHFPLQLTEKEKEDWASNVTFIGTWMPERGPFLARLIELGVPLSVYGNGWQKADEWRVLKSAWRGPGLLNRDYITAIQCAKVCLGLVSKGNRDMHTTRTAEIPYAGGLLCAERTFEHVNMYRENDEAVFWSTPEECAEKCFGLLSDETRRQKIAEAGRQRCIQSGYLNEPVVQNILVALMHPQGLTSSITTESEMVI